MNLSTIKEKLFIKYLYWRTRPAFILNHLHKKRIINTSNCSLIDHHKVKVGACQLEAELFTNPLDYVDMICKHIKLAAKKGVQLLVFPENNSFQLLGLLPGIENIAKNTRGINDDLPKIADLFRLVGPIFDRVIQTTFSFLAASYGMHIMAGSFVLPDKEKVVNRAFLYGPDGSLLGFQDKAHLMPIEDEWGLARGHNFQVFATPLGKLAMPICMDATYFETFRLLSLLGAEIVMVPIANAEPYNYWLALRGIWPRVQESLVYGIKSALVGELLGFTLTGKAGIFAPLELTPQKDGVLAEAKHYNREDLVTAVLNLHSLKELKKNHPYLGDKNPALMEKYFPAVYQG